jgi:alkylation response protein AidB-like acyl-CoA dehydrogenase
MTTTIEQETKTPGGAAAVDWIARARAIAPLVAETSDQTEREAAVPEKLMAALHDAELFRMLLPRSVGGGEATPLEYMEVMRVIGGADASTAWCLGQALGCTFAAAYLAPEIAKEIFGPKDAVLAWGPGNPSGKAIAVDGGYRASGRWRFASGSRRATWIGAHCKVFEEDGSPRMDENGQQVNRTMLMPISEVKTHDVWQVIGLRGTGSDDYEVEDKFVADAYTTYRDSIPDRRETGPLYRIPVLTAYGIGFSGLAIGIAESTLNAFMELAKTKVSAGFQAPLRETAVIQSDTAQAHAKIYTSHAYLRDMISEYWDCLCAGEEPSLDLRGRLRISITWSMNQSKEAIDFAYTAAGTNAIFESGPFERRLRDIHTLTQQGQAHRANFEFAGRALYGLTPGRRL